MSDLFYLIKETIKYKGISKSLFEGHKPHLKLNRNFVCLCISYQATTFVYEIKINQQFHQVKIWENTVIQVKNTKCSNDYQLYTIYITVIDKHANKLLSNDDQKHDIKKYYSEIRYMIREDYARLSRMYSMMNG